MTTWATMKRLRRAAVWESWRLRGEIVTPRPGWHLRADCACVDPAVFTEPENEALALSICATCPVRLDCLAAAIAEESHVSVTNRHWVRGGLPARARTTPFVRPPPECGTDAGYHAHRSRGEDACDACKLGHSKANYGRDGVRGVSNHHRVALPGAVGAVGPVQLALEVAP